MYYISDGSSIKNSEFHSFAELTLKVQMYIDDFEPVNGMGFKSNKHKAMAIYYIIRNIEPKLNSQLTNIHLLAICFFSRCKKYGWDKILHSLVSEIKYLESEGTKVDFIEQQ